MGKLPKIRILHHDPPSSGRVTIRRQINHPVWGSTWIEREVGPHRGTLSSSEAAAYLGITLVWLYHLVKEGKLHPKKQGGRLVFPFREMRRYRRGRESRAKTGGYQR